ncbi:hypothetical protein V5799_030666 [Amblyomma americanum]|uniref:Uncharacterized protein n=1 Tax=Amblyomma americanum TaxID=6943 RepID=A0AAQ4EN42_AMBAM
MAASRQVRIRSGGVPAVIGAVVGVCGCRLPEHRRLTWSDDARRLSSSSSGSSSGGVAKGPSQQWREEGGEQDITKLSDDAFESVLRELVECKPQARSSSLVRSLRREVRDQEELFDGSRHTLPLLSSSASSGGHHQPRHHHRPGGSVSLQDLASSPMPSSSLARPRGGGVPNPAGRGMRQVTGSRLVETRVGRLDHNSEASAGGGGGGGEASRAVAAAADEDKSSAAAAAAFCRVDEPSSVKMPLLVRPKVDLELVTMKNGSIFANDDNEVAAQDHSATRRITATFDHHHTFITAKDLCMDKDGRMSVFGGDAGTVATFTQSHNRDGEPHSNNGSYSTRKTKKSRNHVDPTVMAEDMTGHRGSDSIDTLLAYIYSDDKGGAPKSSNSNGGNGMAPGNTENRKGKNMRKGVTSSSNSSGGTKNSSLSSPPPGQTEEKEVQEGLSEDVVNNNFDSSHRRAVFEDAPLVGGDGNSPGEKERSFSPSFYSDYGTETEPAGSYRVDLSSFSDVDQIQESEFRLVTKKQRRRAQLKKAATTVCESFHRPLGGGSAGASGCLPSAFTNVSGNGSVEDSVRRAGAHSLESLPQSQPHQRSGIGPRSMRHEPPASVAGGGRQHNYTGSAPPSEPSSPENSDLDSVHSLPVSSGSTSVAAAATAVLQTSYADIARMSCRARAGTNGGGAAVSSTAAENPVPSQQQQQTPVRPTSQGAEAAVAVMAPATTASLATAAGAGRQEDVSSSGECFQSSGDNGRSSPAVVLMDDVGGPPPVALGEITFGFDVNEQLVRMSLDSQFHCVPSGGTLGERGEPAPAPAAAAAPVTTAAASPRFDGRPEELGRFNHRDVVDFLDWEWMRACQSYEKEGSSGSKAKVLYYCDASSAGQWQQNS